ncbi:Aldolase-type TIM barrel [Phytophthora cactorum]|nr:Aldolase-type TIM barrel [Phytophthora cactorum]
MLLTFFGTACPLLSLLQTPQVGIPEFAPQLSSRNASTQSHPAPETERVTKRQRLEDRNVVAIKPLVPPACVLEELPVTPEVHDLVDATRDAVSRILHGQDDRLVVVVGPCSIHDVEAAMDYAKRLKTLADELNGELLSFKINKGIRIARKLLLDVNSLGLPVSLEFLDTISPQFTSDLISWGAIGARTTESQLHRELTSGLSMPVGFKNGTGGNAKVAVDAAGNKDCHVILRGGSDGPNYEQKYIDEAAALLVKAKQPSKIMVDCSHGNSRKLHANQPKVASYLAGIVAEGNSNVLGVMIESNIVEGNQSLGDDPSKLVYGQSITDACINWDDTVTTLKELADAVTKRLRRLHPKKIALGSVPSMDGQSYSGGFTLSAGEPLATLDYDYEVAGLPYFVASSVSNGPVEIEVKYAEQFPALSLNYSDGPSQFTTSIANSRRVETHRFTAGNIVFSIDGHQVFDIILTEMGFTDEQLSFYGYASRGEGAIGFGGWQDQASYVRNVTATSLSDSSEVLYSNPMTDESVVVPEFGGQSNAYGIAGTWEFLFEYQADYGQFPGFAPISYQSPMPTPEVFLNDAGTVDAFYNFPDYVILGMIGLVSYMDYFDDDAFVKAHWEEFTRAMTWLIDNQGRNGLIDLTKYVVVFLGPGAGMAVNAAAVQCLDGMAGVARAVGDLESANSWIQVAASVKTAINELFWNDTLGNYAVDVSTPEVYGVSATAFALTSGVANETQIKSLLTPGRSASRPRPQSASNPVSIVAALHLAGLPYFVVSSVSDGPVDVEVKYSEQFPVLSTNFSDGPSQYATAVANSRRVETHRFTINEIGVTVTSMLSQPGQRWQTLRLLSGDSITFESVGLQASVEVIDDLSTLPGKFSSSNAKYNEIWELGARAVSAACLDAGSQVSSWESSEVNGTFVPGTRPGVSYKTWNLSDYTIEFETQIIRGGVGFYVGYDITANRGSLMFHLSSEYPADSTYVNINSTLFPANTLTLTYGFDFVNATDMTSYVLVLPEFGVQSNTYAACLDGAKRDRYIWLGDFYHTTRIMGVANSKPEQITGTWEYLIDYQASNGQFPGLMVMTYETPMPTPEVFMFNAGTSDPYLNFPDYDILGLIGFVSYMEYYDDVAFAKANWESLRKATTWLVSCQGSDGLLDVTRYVAVFLGPGTGTAVNAAAVQCLEGMARVAKAVRDETSANQWVEVASSIKTSINNLLWNDTLGNYAVDASTLEVYGVSAIAFAITSGVANETQSELCVKSLDNLRRGPGYLDTSATDNSTKISPNTNGFLLDALLQTGHTNEAAFLLDNLWDAMISNENYRSGASWEYVSQSLEPGLEEFTSLSHPWGGAPTYLLTNYVAGIRPVSLGSAAGS